MRITLILLLTCLFVSSAQAQKQKQRPNILWLFAEDTSPWMGCYGHAVNKGETPHIDSLAEQGVRFSRAFVPAPVCSACRSALMGGQSQIRFGAHEHRSSRGPAKLYLPDGMKLLPQLVKESGYYTFNLGKDDYNFIWDQKATYSLQQKKSSPVPWDKLKANQPFFGQIQTAGGKINTKNLAADRKVDPASVTVPPDYPQNQIYREVVAQHYDAIRADDDFIGNVLDGIKEAGLADNTIVVYFGDHGANNLVRHKQMPTEGGLHVPFIIAGPDPWVPASSVRDDLVNLLDLSATTLTWAGVKVPDWYEGQSLFDELRIPPEFVAAAKDRLDHTIDRVRTVRTHRYRYTRNYKTDRVFLQPQYRDPKNYVQNLRELYATGELSPKLTEIYFGERPAEELHDVISDPHQLNNLVNDPKYAAELSRHRKLLDDWLADGEMGVGEESDEEMAFQADGQKWGRAVNPEYEVVRTDSDGDGLSDPWEEINGRDPKDGKLLFTFDCGGWQTEGWTGESKLGNIAGRQGFLDFELSDGKGKLTREGLKSDPGKNQGMFVLSAAASAATTVTVFATQQGAANPVRIAGFKLAAGPTCQEQSVSMSKPFSTNELITSLAIEFDSAPGTTVTIESIEIR